LLGLRVQRGRLLSGVDSRAGARVCVLGGALAQRLFGYDDPVGQFIRIQSEHFAIVGVLTGQSGPPAVGALAWRDLSAAVLTSLTAVSGRETLAPADQAVNEIWLQADDSDEVETTGRIVRDTMSHLHGSASSFDVIVPRELLAQRYQTQRTFSVVIGSIAAIALLIGGIGIMNIMLTSVVERTHEIGIRRTVGATRNDITLQFLTESLLMTLVGGVLGIAIGVASALAITAYAGWSTYVSPVAVLLGITVSLSVGLIFGLYPAMKAARLEPVDALRYE
jgi:putative ABC transport system permease protein